MSLTPKLGQLDCGHNDVRPKVKVVQPVGQYVERLLLPALVIACALINNLSPLLGAQREKPELPD